MMVVIVLKVHVYVFVYNR